MPTRVVHCLREPYDVYIGRWNPKVPINSKWANPFKISNHLSREDAIAMFRFYLMHNQDLLDQVGELKGKTLGCWCVDKPVDHIREQKQCHGEVLLELAETYSKPEAK